MGGKDILSPICHPYIPLHFEDTIFYTCFCNFWLHCATITGGKPPEKTVLYIIGSKNSKDSRNLYCRTSSKDSTFEIARERESPKTTHSNIQLVTSRSFDSTPWVSSSAILLERGRVRDYMVSGRTLIV